MKSPVIIFFLLFSLLAVNLAAADNILKEELSGVHSHASHNHQRHLDATDQVSSNTDSSDESGCNHFCHISAHLAGFASQVTQPMAINTNTSFATINEIMHSLSIAPPSQPPRV